LKIRGQVKVHHHRFNDASGKFATGVNDTIGNLPPASTTQVVNFAISTARAVDTCGKFSASVNDIKLLTP
jgi:hypothetical protein